MKRWSDNVPDNELRNSVDAWHAATVEANAEIRALKALMRYTARFLDKHLSTIGPSAFSLANRLNAAAGSEEK